MSDDADVVKRLSDYADRLQDAQYKQMREHITHQAAAKALCHYPSGPSSVNSCCQGIPRCEMDAAIAEITRLRATISQIMTPGDNYKRLNAALATARREGMEEAAQRLQELHRNHKYNPKTGEGREHDVGYYRAISEGVAHILYAAKEG